MTDKIIDEVMGLVGKYGTAVEATCTGNPENYTLHSEEQVAFRAIQAKLREVLERKSLSDTDVNLMAHNLDEGDWDSLVNRNCWLGGFQQGFREAEKHHQIGAE